MKPFRCQTIAEFHRFRKLPKPNHPLISLIDIGSLKPESWSTPEPGTLVLDFYVIALKRHFPAKMKYGQQIYDFDEGVMSFMAPGQVYSLEPVPQTSANHSGWVLLIHPDFLWQTALAGIIKSYAYFDYAVHEALFLSAKEEAIVATIIEQIDQEYRTNIDTFSQAIIIAQIEVLLAYAQRFYSRQFITRKITNHGILNRLAEVMNNYFQSDAVARHGLPTVRYVAESLNISANYLSQVLTVLSGQSTQQHIHDRLIAQAKADLSATDLTVSQIAFRLGFEHSQSFSKLFKQKTNQSPLDFRRSLAS